MFLSSHILNISSSWFWQSYVNFNCSKFLLTNMELFHSTRKYFKMMGIYDCDSFNWRNLLFLVATFKFAISSGGVVVLSKAKNTAENAYAFYQTINAMSAMFAILICIRKNKNIFKMIHCFELCIERSEFLLFLLTFSCFFNYFLLSLFRTC